MYQSQIAKTLALAVVPVIAIPTEQSAPARAPAERDRRERAVAGRRRRAARRREGRAVARAARVDERRHAGHVGDGAGHGAGPQGGETQEIDRPDERSDKFVWNFYIIIPKLIVTKIQ